jgi:hypothetical protein
MTVIKQSDMQVAMSDEGKLSVRVADAGDMALFRVTLPAGADFTPALEAAGGAGRCQVPHWMFVISGALQIRHNDGRVDIGRAGDFIYAEPGHTALCEVDTEFIEVSPRVPIRELLDKMAAAATA